MKFCKVCKERKEYSKFYKRKASLDGLAYNCKSCCSKRDQGYYLKNPEKYKIKASKWREDNLIRCREIVKNACRRSYLKDPQKHRDKSTKYRRDHPDKIRILDAARKRQVRKSTPKWAKSGSIKRLIENIYLNKPKGMVVDHIVPLRGKVVSGLHVPWNLQYLSPVENLRKSNKF